MNTLMGTPIITALYAQAYRMLNYSQQDIETIYSVLTPNEKETVRAEYDRLLAGGKPYQEVLNSIFATEAILIDLATRNASQNTNKSLIA
jgi:hypothetical protein